MIIMVKHWSFVKSYKYGDVHVMGKSCSLGFLYFLQMICLSVIFSYFPFWFRGRILVLIVPVPGHCLSYMRFW